ncbi:MAG TPA: hypothetical protein VKG05_11695 [Steroidobacteraceae bacterium]|nr:hypothetical protein [Steroidobacteraceae bacterium]
MANAAGASTAPTTIVPVIDFRRHSMVLEWHTLGGTWAAYDIPPELVKGIALIRPSLPNICVFAQGGQLQLQIGPTQFALSEPSTRIRCIPRIASFGLRRRFTIESSGGRVLYSYAYWIGKGQDFFRWLAAKAADPDWRATSGRQWSEGVASAALRLA